MTRIPLRPLARILDARTKGENPDAIERENLRLRHVELHCYLSHQDLNRKD